MFFKRYLTDSDEDNLLSEIKQLKKKQKITIKDYEKTLDELQEMTSKYIQILEEKGKGFDQYLHYYDQCVDLTSKWKEEKQIKAELKTQLLSYMNEVGEYIKSIDKLLPKIKDCKDEESFYEVLKKYAYGNIELPTKTVYSLCKKFHITKESFENEQPKIYELLGVDKWDILDEGK